MDNEKVKEFSGRAYNWFWNKWKTRCYQGTDMWDAVVKDAKRLCVNMTAECARDYSGPADRAEERVGEMEG
ncbi:hypothetical protein [Enterocloster sp.]|uniref:hypothetical protein n=1 Tax=Enterocloster sp. TaxID=2719315 RepID=UPI00399F5FC2